MTRDLVPLDLPSAPGPATGSPAVDVDAAIRAGAQLAKSGFFPDARAEAQAVAKVLAGAELGIGPVASLRGIRFIEGQLSLGAGLIAALIKRSPVYDFAVEESSDTICRLAFFERRRRTGSVSYTLEEARRAGLLDKLNWKSYPSDMLFARCISRGGRRYCPDLFIGAIYVPEELGGAEGEPLAGDWEADSEPDDTPTVADQDPVTRARKRFFAVARDHGLERDVPAETRRAIHRALGLPEDEGHLRAWAAEHGWDAARKLLEDGQTVADYPQQAEQPPLVDIPPAWVDPADVLRRR